MLNELKETLAVKGISVEWTAATQAFIAENLFPAVLEHGT